MPRRPAPTPHSASKSGARSATSAPRARSISRDLLASSWMRRAIRRSTSRDAVWRRPQPRDRRHQLTLGHGAARRRRSSSGAVTITASNWLSAAVRALIAPRRSSRSSRSCSRWPPPRGRLRPSPATTPPRRQRGVDQIILAAAPLATLGPLTLKHRLAVIGQERGQTRAVAAASLDPKRRLTQRMRPRQQLPIPAAVAATVSESISRPSRSSATATCHCLCVSTPIATVHQVT